MQNHQKRPRVDFLKTMAAVQSENIKPPVYYLATELADLRLSSSPVKRPVHDTTIKNINPETRMECRQCHAIVPEFISFHLIS